MLKTKEPNSPANLLVCTVVCQIQMYKVKVNVQFCLLDYVIVRDCLHSKQGDAVEMASVL